MVDGCAPLVPYLTFSSLGTPTKRRDQRVARLRDSARLLASLRSDEAWEARVRAESHTPPVSRLLSAHAWHDAFAPAEIERVVALARWPSGLGFAAPLKNTGRRVGCRGAVGSGETTTTGRRGRLRRDDSGETTSTTGRETTTGARRRRQRRRRRVNEGETMGLGRGVDDGDDGSAHRRRGRVGETASPARRRFRRDNDDDGARDDERARRRRRLGRRGAARTARRRIRGARRRRRDDDDDDDGAARRRRGRVDDGETTTSARCRRRRGARRRRRGASTTSARRRHPVLPARARSAAKIIERGLRRSTRTCRSTAG